MRFSVRAAFIFDALESRRFGLPCRIRNSPYLWSTILNDEAIEVRRDSNEFLVAIPTGEDRTKHVLEILFETANADVSVLAETTQQSLQVSIDTDKGTASSIDILQQTWDVRYPSSSMLVNYSGGFHPLSKMGKTRLAAIRQCDGRPAFNTRRDRSADSRGDCRPVAVRHDTAGDQTPAGRA